MMAPYIEAFGCPAVGKSYVTGRLLALPEVRQAGVQSELFPISRGQRLSRVPRKLWLILSYLPTLRSEWRRLTSLVWHTPWVSLPEAGRALLNWIQLLSMLQRLHRHEGAILLCQGVFQAIWSLRFRTRSAGPAFPLQDWVALTLSLLPPRPIVVLHVVAGAEAIRHRQHNRVGGQSMLDRRHSAVHSPSQVVQEVLDAIRALESAGKLRVVTFDNSAASLSNEALCALALTLGLGQPSRPDLVQTSSAGVV